MGDVVVFGPGDPAGGEEERVELHAQRLSSHVLDGQLAAEGGEQLTHHESKAFTTQSNKRDVATATTPGFANDFY